MHFNLLSWVQIEIEISHVLKAVARSFRIFITITFPCKVAVEVGFSQPIPRSPQKLGFDISLSAERSVVAVMLTFP